MGKVKNKKRVSVDAIQKKRQNQNAKKQLNPFEVHINKEKMRVLGKKVKNEMGLPGISRAKAIKKRKHTLLNEYKLQHKSNKFMDKRIAERDHVPNEDKIMARFAAVRAKAHSKKVIFNLAEDEVLTHRGQTLGEIEKFDDPRSDNEESDDENKSGNLLSNFVKDAHFGGGNTGKEVKSHRQLMDQLIEESKKRKAEKQKTKEATVELTEKLDTAWKDLAQLVSKKTDKKENNEEKPKLDDYDKVMRELKFEARGTVSDRLKSENEIAKEDKERLEKLEQERLERMRDFVENNPQKITHRSADDLDDDFVYESDTEENMLTYDNEGQSNVQVRAELNGKTLVGDNDVEVENNDTDSSNEDNDSESTEDSAEESSSLDSSEDESSNGENCVEIEETHKDADSPQKDTGRNSAKDSAASLDWNETSSDEVSSLGIIEESSETHKDADSPQKDTGRNSAKDSAKQSSSLAWNETSSDEEDSLGIIEVSSESHKDADSPQKDTGRNSAKDSAKQNSSLAWNETSSDDEESLGIIEVSSESHKDADSPQKDTGSNSAKYPAKQSSSLAWDASSEDEVSSLGIIEESSETHKDADSPQKDTGSNSAKYPAKQGSSLAWNETSSDEDSLGIIEVSSESHKDADSPQKDTGHNSSKDSAKQSSSLAWDASSEDEVSSLGIIEESSETHKDADSPQKDTGRNSAKDSAKQNSSLAWNDTSSDDEDSLGIIEELWETHKNYAKKVSSEKKFANNSVEDEYTSGKESDVQIIETTEPNKVESKTGNNLNKISRDPRKRKSEYVDVEDNLSKKLKNVDTIEGGTENLELPFVFELPENYNSLMKMLQNHSILGKKVILERMIKCNHPTLSKKNKVGLTLLFKYMLQYMNDLFVATEDIKTYVENFKLLMRITPHITDLAQFNEENAHSQFLHLIENHRLKYLVVKKEYPGLEVLYSFLLVILLFSTSDFKHQVVMPCLLFIEEMLTNCRVKSVKDLCYGLTLCRLAAQLTRLSKRFLPALIKFLAGIFYLAIPSERKPKKGPLLFKSLSSVLALTRNCSNKKIKTEFSIANFFEEEFTDDLRVVIMLSALKLINAFKEKFNELSGKFGGFHEADRYLKLVPMENYPNKVQEEFVTWFRHTTVRMRSLSWEAKKPKALRLYEPRIVDVRDGKRRKVQSREKTERDKLEHKLKKETKGAIREIRKDKAFLGRVKINQKIKSDKERRDRVNKIVAEAANQQSELNAFDRQKKKKK